MKMKKLYEHAQQIATEAQILADNLAEYNPGIEKKNKVPLRTLRYNAACLAREFAKLYSEIVSDR